MLSASSMNSSVRHLFRKRLSRSSTKFRRISSSEDRFPPEASSAVNIAGPEQQQSRAVAEENYSPATLWRACSNGFARNEWDAALIRGRTQHVNLSIGGGFPRITGPRRRRIRQFGSRGGTPCIPRHVSPACRRRSWTRETVRPVEQAQYSRASINTH